MKRNLSLPLRSLCASVSHFVMLADYRVPRQHPSMLQVVHLAKWCQPFTNSMLLANSMPNSRCVLPLHRECASVVWLCVLARHRELQRRQSGAGLKSVAPKKNLCISTQRMMMSGQSVIVRFVMSTLKLPCSIKDLCTDRQTVCNKAWIAPRRTQWGVNVLRP